MTEKYTNLIKKSSKKRRQNRIIIKNGIQYIITLTTDKKPRFKKTKYIKTKKWIIRDVLLNSFDIIDKGEIEDIIYDDKKQQESYDKCFQMDKDELYTLMLSDKQFKSLTHFLDVSNVAIGTKISMIRKGLGFKTRISFYTSLKAK